MNILITGGLGNLGSWLTGHLARSGFNVTTFSSRDRDILQNCKFEKVFGDISNQAELNKLFSEREFNAVIHLASINESNISRYAEKALNINTLGTRNLLQAIADSNKTDTHFIYFSTIHIYGNLSDKIEEKTFPNPLNDYAITHLFAEYYVKQFHYNHEIPFTIFRLTNGYGAPKDKNSSKWYLVLNDLVKSAFENKLIKLNSNGQPSRDFIWLGDVCKIVEKSLTGNPSNNVFNLGSGRNLSILEMAEIVAVIYRELYGDEIRISINENDHNDYKKQIVSVEKLKKHFAIEPQNKIADEARKIFKFLENFDQNL